MLKTGKWLGFWLTMLALAGLLLTACGDSTSTGTTSTSGTTSSATSSSATTAAMSTNAATTAAMTTAAATTSSSATTAASGSATGEVIVFAAASLTDPFNQIKAEVEKANPGLTIKISYGGSNTLRAQLEQGAKADVFASANQTEMDNALKSNLVADKGSVFVRNRLVVIIPKNNPGGIQKLQDLAKPGLKFVTAQKDVPVGNYTLQALDKMSKDPAYGSDFSQKVQANFASKETDVKQVVAKIQLGEADAGIVYLSDVSAKVKDAVTTLEIPDQFNTLAVYPIAILKAAPNSAGAKAFVDYVLSDKGQTILKNDNFIPASGTTTSGATNGNSERLF